MLSLIELMGLGCGVEFIGPELSLAFLPHWTLPFLTLCSSENRATPGTAGRPLVLWLQLGLSLPIFPPLHSLKWYSLRAVMTRVYLFTFSEVQMCI